MYKRNPKDPGGSKHVCAQDEEDFAQERAIQDWLEREGRVDDFGFEHINRKGNARNTLVRAQVRLDAKVQEDGSSTFADLIAGCDGRDLECAGGDRPADGDAEPTYSAAVHLESELDLFCKGIGLTGGETEWVKKSVKSAASLQNLRSLMKEEKHSEWSRINLESLKPLRNFNE